MTDRPTLERELNDIRRSLTQLERDARQLRDYISSNERAINGMPDALRRITEDGIARARTDLGQRESDIRYYRETLAGNERLLSILNDIDRKEREIVGLERDQERIMVQLERVRSELGQLQSSYDSLTRPATLPPPLCELVLQTNQRIPLHAQQEYTIGWFDGSTQPAPTIDLAPLSAGTLGVSRSHARLRSRNGAWEIEDLGSTNGTFVNDTPLAPYKGFTLADRTTIRLGSIKIFFHYLAQTTRLSS